MTDAIGRKAYTFLMPVEERFFFDHFYKIAITLLIIISWLGVYVSEVAAAHALVQGLVIVLPMCVLYLVYGKRFADVVTLDFDARKARFSFHDERGTFERDFHEIKRVNFQFYLTFVLDDARFMIKRPKNKKEILRMLAPVFTVNCGLFGGL